MSSFKVFIPDTSKSSAYFKLKPNIPHKSELRQSAPFSRYVILVYYTFSHRVCLNPSCTFCILLQTNKPTDRQTWKGNSDSCFWQMCNPAVCHLLTIKHQADFEKNQLFNTVDLAAKEQIFKRDLLYCMWKEGKRCYLLDVIKIWCYVYNAFLLHLNVLLPLVIHLPSWSIYLTLWLS